MKRYFGLLIVAVFLSGCDGMNPPGGESGIIVIDLPGALVRSPSSADIMSKAEVIEAIAYNANRKISLVPTPDGGSAFPVPEGTYSVIVLAGRRISPDDDGLRLVCSGSRADVAVIGGAVTVVPVTLADIEYSITVPASVEPGHAFPVSVTVRTHNDCLKPTSVNVYVDTPRNSGPLTLRGDTGTASLTAPRTSGFFPVKISRCDFILRNESYGITGVPLSGFASLDWTGLRAGDGPQDAVSTTLTVSSGYAASER